MEVIWTPRALDSLEGIHQYIARDNPDAAARFVTRLFDRGERVGFAPRAGRVVPEFARQELREVLEGNYRIVYEVAADSVFILFVFEGHRQLRASDITGDE